ncbi:terminase [Streptomyces phage Zuko]|uniref:Terminase n=1 Tax=Streptomyces phage Zuko TaxID=2601695 RepID=A0A5J6D7Y3_9CAUD|nr:terminase large subunit [Streptomyces phage Zuko]QEQ93585.1 terminase [Streptomyces phage Zuko]
MVTTLADDPLGPTVNASTFDHEVYLANAITFAASIDGQGWSGERPLTQVIPLGDGTTEQVFTQAGRIYMTKHDPMLFALVYCRNLITDDAGNISFAELHLELCRYVQRWKEPIKARESRTAFVAPREAGKSSWVFKILPLWASCHEHVKFIAAFSSSATQAQKHLSGFKRQVDTNQLIRADFPKLVTPAKRPSGGNVADTQEMYHSQSEFTFTAAGLDSEILGLVDPQNRRPDLIILDDIEPDEANYSQYQMRKRLITVIDTVLAMNERAHVALIGTVTMPGSIVHQLVETVTTTKEVPKWITDENFNVVYLEPILQNEDGTDRSIWPFKWPLEYLNSIKHTTSFKKNFLNQPIRMDGDYWVPEDFQYWECGDDATHTLLQIDPATTSKTSSDYYGVAVIEYDPGKSVVENGKRKIIRPKRCSVLYCRQFRLSPKLMRAKALEICEAFPQIGRIRVESNQGGEAWLSVFHDMPVKVVIHSEHINKKVRASHLLNHYQRNRVGHAKPLPELEAQMLAFPNVLNDDMVDAVGAGVAFFLKPPKTAGGSSQKY